VARTVAPRFVRLLAGRVRSCTAIGSTNAARRAGTRGLAPEDRRQCADEKRNRPRWRGKNRPRSRRQYIRHSRLDPKPGDQDGKQNCQRDQETARQRNGGAAALASLSAPDRGQSARQ